MSLESAQRALARLYLDDAFRERFYAAPDEAAREAGLDAADVAGLLAVDRSRVEAFAASLRRKRLGEVRGLLPALAAALGAERFEALFLEFARDFVPEGVHKHRADALAFAAWAAGRAGGDAREAAEFERARLGLFYRLEGRSAAARPGPSLALARRHGRRLLLVRSRGASRYRVVGR